MTSSDTARRAVGRAARRAMKSAARGVDLLHPPTPGLTILIYHRVGSSDDSQMSLPTARFDEQMSRLAADHRVVDLDGACDEIDDAARTGRDVEPGVVITFDDGTDDWSTTVLPILERHGLPATFYVTSGFVDSELELPSDGVPATWNQLRELAASPLVTIGSHTRTHRLLRGLDEETTLAELEHCDRRIHDELGVEVRHFAYPKAVDGSSAARRLVATRYRSAVLAGTSANGPNAALHGLARSPIQRDDSVGDVERKFVGGLHGEDVIRGRLNKWRYRGAER